MCPLMYLFFVFFVKKGEMENFKNKIAKHNKTKDMKQPLLHRTDAIILNTTTQFFIFVKFINYLFLASIFSRI